MADLSGYTINTLAFQPNNPVEINLPPPPTFDFQTSPAPTYNPATAFGPSVVTGGNTANLKTSIVPSNVPDFFSTDTPGQQPPQTSIGSNPTTGLPTTTGSGGVSNGNGDSFSFNDPNSTLNATPDNSTIGTTPTTSTDLPGAIGQGLGLPSFLTDPNNPLTSIFNGIGGTNLPTTPATGSTFYQGVLNNVKDFIVRFGLILLAIALIAVAAWALSKGGLQKQAARLIA